MQALRPRQTNRTYRFGDFEYCARSGELSHHGAPVRLQYQPLCVLQVLLENSGEVVTRDEIREHVWQDAPIQDFDNSLRVAMTKLRQALGDDAETPQYIETLPRRGYRWLYPVTTVESPNNGTHEEGASSEGGVARSSGPPPAALRYSKFGGSALITVALWTAALGAWWFLRATPSAPEPKVVPLTTYPGLETTPALSPDGKLVAFAWTGPNSDGPYGVYVKGTSDDRAHRIADPPAGASDGDPVWSPDGKSIYFFRRGAGQTGIYVVPSAGGAVQQVVATSMGGHRLRRARFDVSPNNTLIYPDQIPGQDTVALFLLDLATFERSQVTSPPPNSEGDGDPAFSHDGKSVVYQRDILDLGQMYVMPAGGGTARMLSSNFITDFIDGVTWTADDREIILGGSQLRRMSIAGGEASIVKVPYVPARASFPSGRNHLLAYVETATNANIWKLRLADLVHADGEPTELISSTHQQAAPSFSPDGSRIAFQSDRSGNWEIWTCDRDGSNAFQLTHFGGAPAGTPRWSPDGKQIAFDLRAKEVSQIYVISSEGGEPRQVTHDASGGQVPGWSRDGKWIYYSNVHGSAAKVWKVPVADSGVPQAVTPNGGLYAIESADGRYLYYSRSAQDPTIWRIPMGGGAEEPAPGVPKPFDSSHWAMVTEGIYVIDGNGDLLFYQFDKRKASKVVHDARFLTDWSMAVSPDGREVVWAQVDDRRADLMLIQNFR